MPLTEVVGHSAYFLGEDVLEELHSVHTVLAAAHAVFFSGDCGLKVVVAAVVLLVNLAFVVENHLQPRGLAAVSSRCLALCPTRDEKASQSADDILLPAWVAVHHVLHQSVGKTLIYSHGDFRYNLCV